MEAAKGVSRQKVLKEAERLETLVNTAGWREVLKPWLEARCHHAWEDPQNVEDVEKFFYRYTVQWAKAEAAHQVLQKVAGTLKHAEAIAEVEARKDEKTKD